MENRVAVVTTFSANGWRDYAHRMVVSWLKNWPTSVDLIVYPDEPVDLPCAPNIRVMGVDMPQKSKFIAKWGSNPLYTGGDPYNYRYDAIKFCHKPFCLADILSRMEEGYRGVIWLDADTITHQRVTPAVVERMAPPRAPLQFLGRSYKYSECGYLWFNFRSDTGQSILRSWQRLYTTGQFRHQREWHDSYLFDVARKLHPHPDIVDLTGHIPRKKGAGHPFINSFLGEHLDHHKGPRKVTGKPKKGDLFVDHDTAYWKENSHAKQRTDKA